MKKAKKQKGNIWPRVEKIQVNFTRSCYIGRAQRTPQKKFSVLPHESTTPSLQKHISAHPSERPVIATPQGKHFHTPGKTELHPQFQFGGFWYLAESASKKQELTEEDLQIEYAQNIKNLLTPSCEKAIEIIFKWSDILRVKREKKKRNGRRAIDQAEVMRGVITTEDDETDEIIHKKVSKRLASANHVARELGIENSKRKKTHEWTHLGGHQFGGKSLQIPKNLLLATVECNTLMMLIENKITKLLKLLKDEFGADNVYGKLNVTGETYPDTHIGTHIDYNVQFYVRESAKHEHTCVLDFSVSFDPQLKLEKGKPTRVLDRYAAAIFNYALEKRGEHVDFTYQDENDSNTANKLAF